MLYAYLIWWCRPGGLVDYEDDEDDEDYKPPPRKHSANSGEDEGVVESFLKRKSTLKEESEPKRLHRSPKMSKPNEGVFAALCSTLSQAVLPSKKTLGTEPEAPRSDMSKNNNEVNNEGKGHTISSDADRSADADDHSEKEKEGGSPQQTPEDLHDCPNNGPIGDDCPLISPKSSPEMAVNGS